VYTVIRRYQGVDQARIPESVERARAELAPRLKSTRGFVGYYLIGDGNTVASISVFEDRESAEESTRAVAQWVRANLLDILPNPPEIIAGDVLLRVEP
jgi:hypothetical protein